MAQPKDTCSRTWIRLYPTASLSIEIPSTAEEYIEEGSASFWISGEYERIQFIFQRREPKAQGRHDGAKARLEAMVSLNQLFLRQVELHLPYEDCASAVMLDREQITWLYIYITWPHLAVLVTVSGDERLVLDENHWTRRVLKSIRV